MLYSEVHGQKLSLLGFGAMRLPTKSDGSIDEATTKAMVDRAMAAGVNYYDTAYPYHGGLSEVVLANCLRDYPRESYFLADKYPGHQIAETYDPSEIFEDQLKKCGVEYFDYYLLHNVYEKSVEVYTDPKWGIIDYFKEQKRLGRIRHLGFSSHASVDCLRAFLDAFGSDMEFCQIQLNYLDWTLENARAKYELLTERGIPVWVMEPLRGGKLASLGIEDTAGLRALRPDESTAAWSFRFLQGLSNVAVVLSGMSAPDQLEDNLKTFASRDPLAEGERSLVLDIAESLKDAIPCTACRYCCDGCPAGLDIPMLLSVYNNIRYAPTTNTAMVIEALPPEKQPTACIGCGACSAVCPQKIDIPTHLREFSETLAKIPSWAEICRQRAEAAKKLKEQAKH
ncbi:MAG: oxidoreductase [Ruminococcaceae bacterium]|nr:oxidoreductase [Oscillospiraceae bacterium]